MSSHGAGRFRAWERGGLSRRRLIAGLASLPALGWMDGTVPKANAASLSPKSVPLTAATPVTATLPVLKYDLFASQLDAGIVTAWGYPDTQIPIPIGSPRPYKWSSIHDDWAQLQLVPDNTTNQATQEGRWSWPIPVSRDPNSIDLFTVGQNKHVYVSTWTETQPWSDWLDLFGGFSHAQLSAAPYNFGGSQSFVSLFIVDQDGYMHETLWYPGKKYVGKSYEWWSYPCHFNAGATITSFFVAQGTGYYQFGIGGDGAVYARDPDTGVWQSLGGSFRPGDEVHAVYRSFDGHNSIDLFVLGTDGKLYTKWQSIPPGATQAPYSADWRHIEAPGPISTLSVISRDWSMIELFAGVYIQDGDPGNSDAGTNRPMTNWIREAPDNNRWWNDTSKGNGPWKGLGMPDWRGDYDYSDVTDICAVSPHPEVLTVFAYNDEPYADPPSSRVHTRTWTALPGPVGPEPTADGVWQPVGGHPTFSNYGEGIRGLAVIARANYEWPNTDPPIVLTTQVTFDNGVPVGGNVSLVLYRDGTAMLTGSFHDSGLPSYDLSFAWGVKTTSGQILTFAHHGHVAGTLQSGSRNDTFTLYGSHPDIRDRWDHLQLGVDNHWEARADFDLDGTIQIVVEVLAAVGETDKAIHVINDN